MIGILYFVFVYFAGEFLATVLLLPVPGSIVGLFISIFFIVLFPNTIERLRNGSLLLLNLLPLFLTPVVVSVVITIHEVGAELNLFGLVTLSVLLVGVVFTALLMKLVMPSERDGKTAAE